MNRHESGDWMVDIHKAVERVNATRDLMFSESAPRSDTSADRPYVDWDRGGSIERPTGGMSTEGLITTGCLGLVLMAGGVFLYAFGSPWSILGGILFFVGFIMLGAALPF